MCPDGSSQSIWCWRLGKFLECYWSSVYIVSQKMLVQTSVEECCRNRVERLKTRSQKQRFLLSYPFIWTATRKHHHHLQRVFLLQMIRSKKIPHGNIQQLVFKLNPDSVKLTTKSELPLLNPLVLF